MFECHGINTTNVLLHLSSPLKPTVSMQQEALSAAITDIIWKAGGGQYGVICLPHPALGHLENSDHFNQDGTVNIFIAIHLLLYGNLDND